MSFARSSLRAATAIAIVVAITGAVRLYPAIANHFQPAPTDAPAVPHQHLSEVTRFRKLAPPPTMVGAPVFMTGPFAGRFPNREWVRQTNLQLNAIGFGDIDPCENRTKGRSYAYMADCDGRLKIVSDMYAAAAFVAGLHPEPEVAEDLPQRGRVPDIVDSTVPLRLQTYGGLFNGSANGATQINTSISGLDSQTALNDPVPFTASRSAIPHLLPQPGMMVADPLPQVAGAGPLQRNHRSSPPAPAPSHQARPQVVQVDSIEKVERPRITDYLPAPADSSRTPAKSTESGGRPAFSPI